MSKKKYPIKLFHKVQCHAYMKKISDGVCIQVYKEDGTFYSNPPKVFKNNDKLIACGINPETRMSYEIKDLSSCDGDSVSKTYYERSEGEFKGVLVGYKHLCCQAQLGTDWGSGYDGSEYGYCFRYETSSPLVGIVYFRNNAKRYVLPEDMEDIEPKPTRKRRKKKSELGTEELIVEQKESVDTSESGSEFRANEPEEEFDEEELEELYGDIL